MLNVKCWTPFVRGWRKTRCQVSSSSKNRFSPELNKEKVTNVPFFPGEVAAKGDIVAYFYVFSPSLKLIEFLNFENFKGILRLRMHSYQG